MMFLKQNKHLKNTAWPQSDFKNFRAFYCVIFISVDNIQMTH